LKKAYAVYQQVLNVAAENAGAIAETYNSIAELLKSVREKAKAVISKLNSNEKPSKTELITLEKLAQTGIETKKKELEALNKQAGADTSSYVSSLKAWITKQEQGLACVVSLQNTESPSPKKGPSYEDYTFACDLSGLTEEEPVNLFNFDFGTITLSCGKVLEVNIDKCKKAVKILKSIKDGNKKGGAVDLSASSMVVDLTISGSCVSKIDFTFTKKEKEKVSIKPEEYDESIFQKKLFFGNELEITVGEPNTGNEGFNILKKYLELDDNIPGTISEINAAIAPSNGSANFKGGTYGCVRTMSIPDEPDKKIEKDFVLDVTIVNL
jgi:hypothetical protein